MSGLVTRRLVLAAAAWRAVRRRRPVGLLAAAWVAPWVLAAAPLPVRPQPPAPAPASDDDTTTAPRLLDLAAQAWTKDGEPASPLIEPHEQGPLVQLAFPALGTRWGTVFETDGRATYRLHLAADLGPEGLLFEIVLDGERLPPPRDGWRPSRRTVELDLGPRWLGAGSHLLEVVAREQRQGGVLRLRHLSLRPLR